MEIATQFHLFSTSGARMVVGAEISGSPHVQMQVAEILVYGHALTVPERGQVVNHLRAKYFDEFCSVPCLPPTITLEGDPDALNTFRRPETIEGLSAYTRRLEGELDAGV